MRILALAFSPRFIVLTACALLTLAFVAAAIGASPHWRTAFLVAVVLFGALSLLGLRDLVQTSHAVLRNYPISAHLRFLLEEMRPEMRQYFFESETDGLPFSRNQRAVVYQRAKMQLDKRPFGTHSTSTRKATSGCAIRSRRRDRRDAVPGPGRRSRLRPALCGVGFQHLGDELRRVERQRHSRPQPRRGARRLRSRHRRRRLQPLSPRGRRRRDLGNRLGLFRLPHRRRRVRSRWLRRRGRQRPDQDDRDQAQPGRQARPRRRAAGGESHRRNRGDPRRAGWPRLPFAGAPRRLLDPARDDGLHRRAQASERRQAGRLQALRRPPLEFSPSARRCWRRESVPTSSSSTARRAAPARRRSNSPTTSACRCATGSSSSTRADRRGLRGDIRRGASARSPTPSTWRARWRSAPTGATRRAASCSRSAASSRCPATPTAARPGRDPGQTRSRALVVEDKPSGCTTIIARC